MVINNTDYVFQTDSDIVRSAFEEDNYITVFNEQCTDKSICAIYFSSNDIYYPNTEDVFRKRIVERDFYEMYNTRVSAAYKHIFIRDIKKQWYIEGINSRVNSPGLLFKMLKLETEGYSVITIGSSAGGYAAVLYGSMLSAKRVFSFNGQFELETLLKTSNPQIDPLLFRNAESEVAKYFDLKNYINKEVGIYYFSSIGSDWDYQQYKHISKISAVRPILFKTSHHGVPFVKAALPRVINLESKALDKMVGKKFNSLIFSIRLIGIRNVFWGLYQQYLQQKRNRK